MLGAEAKKETCPPNIHSLPLPHRSLVLVRMGMCPAEHYLSAALDTTGGHVTLHGRQDINGIPLSWNSGKDFFKWVTVPQCPFDSLLQFLLSGLSM